MADLTDLRVRAALELDYAKAREYVGLHEYDGRLQDLSPAGVATALRDLGRGPLPDDPFDAAVMEIHEDGLRAWFEEAEVHRRDPLLHVRAMDVACYDREYASSAERRRAKELHLEAWPDAVDNAVMSLDRVPAPVATASLAAVRGLGEGVDDPRARIAVDRFATHVEAAARDGDPSAALGPDLFLWLLGAARGSMTTTARRSNRKPSVPAHRRARPDRMSAGWDSAVSYGRRPATGTGCQVPDLDAPRGQTTSTASPARRAAATVSAVPPPRPVGALPSQTATRRSAPWRSRRLAAS